MSNPITMAIACLLSSEAGIVPRHEDDTGHAIYQVTLGGLGKAAATQRWKVSPRATFGNRVSRRRPESWQHAGRHHYAESDSEFGNAPWIRLWSLAQASTTQRPFPFARAVTSSNPP